MGTIDGLNKARMLAIEASSVVNGLINGSGHLILTRHDNSTIDAGNVVGPTGLTPDLRGLSVTSVAIATGSKTFAISPAMAVAFPVGATVKAQGAAAGNYMVGLVTAASTTSVTINVTEIAGTGTFASWTLVLGSFRGTDGVLTGAAGGDLTGTYPNPTIGLLKVITGYLADLAVTTIKIADGAVTRAKLATGLAVPVGGTTGQMLTKNTATDGDTGWTTPNPKITRGLTTASFDATGTATIPHGQSATPTAVVAIIASQEGQSNTIHIVAGSIGVTNFQLRLRDSTTGAAIVSVTRIISWVAVA